MKEDNARKRREGGRGEMDDEGVKICKAIEIRERNGEKGEGGEMYSEVKGWLV